MITIRKFEAKDVARMAEIWNQVVEDGVAFPQEEGLTGAEAAEFFAAQTVSAVAEDEQGNVKGLYSAPQQYRQSRAYRQCQLCSGQSLPGRAYRRTAGKRLSGAGKSKRLPRIAVQCGGGFQYPCVPSIPETGIRGSGHYSGRLPQ